MRTRHNTKYHNSGQRIMDNGLEQLTMDTIHSIAVDQWGWPPCYHELRAASWFPAATATAYGHILALGYRILAIGATPHNGLAMAMGNLGIWALSSFVFRRTRTDASCQMPAAAFSGHLAEAMRPVSRYQGIQYQVPGPRCQCFSARARCRCEAPCAIARSDPQLY
jgi:hypothetical protein